MKRAPFVATATLAVLTTGGRAWADDPGTTAAPVLQVPLGARALGMGGAFTAVATDATALQYNPAGLARLNAHEADVTYVAGAGESTLQHLAYAGPTPFTGVSGYGYTSVAASLLLSQSGTIEVNRLNSNGSLASSESISAGSDLVLSGGYAERAAMTSFALGGVDVDLDHFVGIGAKYLRSTLAETYHASAFAADFGYLASWPERGWSLGASALNLGTKLRFEEVSDPLPMTYRTGIAWQGAVSSLRSVVAAMDGEYLPDEKSWRINVGAENFWEKRYGLRLGYQFHRGDQGGLTFGFGLRWKGRVLFDYAWALGDELGAAHRFTISYRFGPVPPAARGQQRRAYTGPAEPEQSLDQRPPSGEEVPRPKPIPRERPAPSTPGWIY